ncbi:HAAAP family serine/threonine permease [Campylobacter hepaticus]|uniref:HAAAP family serine/threonine permease n=1 Tax=Campylobacter hepaticus TaxID=1813019 RepID=A0A6A7JS39_9BACT|nr:aromatic amino acid transport family protein [Campylobacter hepaticus]AXP09318.1 HAAAP family serine/threonine permease [Campylobacter hepaticus]MCZ0772937.1 HAAAP family serine/threonine permease [Campylobacter hepaticus]MCZ0774406.1 HAAAP family serine/threonine permease [Campylobacter hepaticus]MCZ0775658.1 HAAAP family serine/threonine permease [Campylobacter hepaticus]MDX2323556.1 HAAAP family serine/threonine permease [Campylobacter hepaticus]
MDTLKWTSYDTRWVLSLFGTAVGAGILFLPIKAGVGGFWPVVVMALIIFPMVYLSHRALSRFVCQANGNDKDITHAAEEYFGRKVSVFISVLYFFAIFPICLAYCVGITNTFESFIYNQFLPLLDPKSTWANAISFMYQVHINEQGKTIANLFPFYRAIFAFVLVSIFMLIMLFSEELITKVCEWLVYPLCAILFIFSLYLIPQWSFESFGIISRTQEFITIVWLTLPVLVFSFNHSPVISTFSLSVKRRYDKNSVQKANQILFRTSVMLLFFVMFFVLSCVLSLSPDELAEARSQNIPVLSYFANKLDNPFISYGGPLVAFFAISSSFFGHYFGAREGAYGIVRKCFKLAGNQNPNLKKIAIYSTLTMYIIMLITAYVNPSILGFIESLGGPIIAAILFLMPIIAIYTVSKMKKFQNKALDAFVFITGILTIITVIYTF